MLRMNFTKWIVGAFAAVVATSLVAGKAEAGWRHHGSSSSGSWGSSSSSGSWGSSSSGSWGSSSSGYWFGSSSSSSSGGSWGWGHHHHHHYMAYGYGGSSSSSSSSSSGSWGSSSSSGSGGWGYRAGSVYTDGDADGDVIMEDGDHPMMSAPKGKAGGQPGKGAPAVPPPAGTPGKSTMLRSNAALLSLEIPADAKVFVNDMATTSTGEQRQYISRGLEPGRTYTYEVRAEVERDGKKLTETKMATLAAGQETDLAFNFDTPSNAEMATTVTVHVPENAKVFLSGHETSSTGEVRQFTTTKLAQGSHWDNYTVKVVAKVDGRELTKSQTITLKAGEDRDLSFDFGNSDVARTAAVTR